MKCASNPQQTYSELKARQKKAYCYKHPILKLKIQTQNKPNIDAIVSI